MDLLIILGALGFLVFMAYRGFSVIIFAPVAALLAILLTEPAAVAPAYFGLFMDKAVAFLKMFLPVFLLGALFGKVIEISGNAQSISNLIVRVFGRQRAILVIVLVCAVLTYGGVQVNVVAFAVYPFAAELFRHTDIPKRLIPGSIALGAFTFSMDSLPGSPQIQNIIPTSFFHTDTWAAPWLGSVGALMIFFAGMLYLEWRRRSAMRAGEGYGSGHLNEPERLSENERLAHPLIALLPMILVCGLNYFLVKWIPQWYGADTYALQLSGMSQPVILDVKAGAAVWGVAAALVVGILVAVVTRWRVVLPKFSSGSAAAASGSVVAVMNSASEYGFGAVMAALPGFVYASKALQGIQDPLFNMAITVTGLSALTGSAIAGLSIALGAMGDTFVAAAHASGIPLEVFHRIAAMACGGMDTLPQNGAVITLLTICGLTHRQSYKDIFAITLIKTAAAGMAILVFYATGIV